MGDVARNVHRLVSEAVNEEISFDVTVTRPGREDQYDTPEDFEHGIGAELRAIEHITISGNPKDFYPWKVRAYICFYNSWSAVWMSVEGAAEISVNGVAHALQTVLDEGHRSLRFPLPVVVPPLELRRVGDPTRLQRLLGRPLRWFGAVVVVAVIGALAAKLLA